MTFIQLLFCHSQGHREASGGPAVHSNMKQYHSDYIKAKKKKRKVPSQWEVQKIQAFPECEENHTEDKQMC